VIRLDYTAQRRRCFALHGENALHQNTIKVSHESQATELSIDRLLEQAANADAVIVDLSALKRLSVKPLEFLVKVKKAMLGKGRFGIVRLVVRSPLIHQTLAVTGLRKLFEVYETVESAVGANAKSEPAAPTRRVA
jgi:anti-anti-sigma factor